MELLVRCRFCDAEHFVRVMERSQIETRCCRVPVAAFRLEPNYHPEYGAPFLSADSTFEGCVRAFAKPTAALPS